MAEQNARAADLPLLMGSLNLRGGNWADRSEGNKVRQVLKQVPPEMAILLFQEVWSNNKWGGLDPRAVGYSHYHGSDSLTILVRRKWAFIRRIHCPPPEIAQHVLVAEIGFRNSSIGTVGIVNLHLPSPTHSKPQLCNQISAYISALIGKWAKTLDWILVAGDFNEVEVPSETTRQYYDPLVIPTLKSMGLDTWPGSQDHTFQQHSAGGEFRSSSRLDRWMISPPPNGVRLTPLPGPQWLVDSDHGFVITGMTIPRTKPKAHPAPLWPLRYPDPSPINGFGYNRLKLVFKTTTLAQAEAASKASLEAEVYGFTRDLNHEHCVLQRGYPLPPEEEAGLGQKLEQIPHLHPSSGTRGLSEALQTMKTSHSWTLSTIQSHVNQAMVTCMQPRKAKPAMRRPETQVPVVEALVCSLRKHVRAHQQGQVHSPKVSKETWRRAELTPTDTLHERLKKIRRTLRNLLRSLRSAAIKLAIRRRQVLEDQDDPRWYSRIKLTSQELRTDAHWDLDGCLNYSPTLTMQHYATQVQSLGSLAQPPTEPTIPAWNSTLTVSTAESLMATVTAEEVNSSLRKTATKRSPGPDSITVKALQSVPPQILALAINRALNDPSHISSTLAEANVRLLNKTAFPYPPPGKFRPIALLSTLYKLVTSILSRRLNTALRKDGLMPDSSHAFLPNTNISHPISLRRSVIEMARADNSTVIISDFDASAAFNSPPHRIIQDTWVAAGCPPKFVDVMATLLRVSSSQVITEHGLAPKMPNLRGSVQGDVISPLHWAGVMAPHQHQWNRHLPHFDLGLPPQRIGMEVYADDVAAYATITAHAERQHEAYHQMCADIGVKSHPGKAVVMVINPPGPTTLTVGGGQIEACATHPECGYRYLGVYFHPDHVRGPFFQARQELLTLNAKYRLCTSNLAELRRLINAMIMPKLRYQLQWTPITSEDICSLQTMINRLMFSRGLPPVLRKATIHGTKALNFKKLETVVHKARWTSYYQLMVKSMSSKSSATTAAASERACIRRATGHLPPGMQGLRIFSQPLTGRHVAKEGSMTRAVCESLSYCGVWWQITDTQGPPTLGMALPARLTAPESKELHQVLGHAPELMYFTGWNDDSGLWINRGLKERFPLLATHVGEELLDGRMVSKWPSLDLPFIPGSFCVIPITATVNGWNAFIMQIQQPMLGDPIQMVRVKTLEVDPVSTIYNLPADTPDELIEADTCSPIALTHRADGTWAIALEHAALVKQYQPNEIARQRVSHQVWCPPSGNNIFTDGSYDDEAVGHASVSNTDSRTSVQCYGGWESDLSTAQEGEIVAMALSLQGIDGGGTIHTDSKFAHDIANRLAQPGRFAPFLCKFIRETAARKRITVRKVKAHLRTDTDPFPSNHFADQWAKLGTQQAFGRLHRGNIPQEWRPPSDTWLTIHSEDGLWIHDPRRYPDPEDETRPTWYKWLGLKAKIKVELTLASYWWTDYDTKMCRRCGADVDSPSHPLVCTHHDKGLLLRWYKLLQSTMPWPMWRLPWIPLWPTAAHAHPSYRQCPEGYVNDDVTRHEFQPPLSPSTIIDTNVIGWATHIDPTSDPADTLAKWAPQGWAVIPPAPLARRIDRANLTSQWVSFSSPQAGDWACPRVLAAAAPQCMALKKRSSHGRVYWSVDACPPPAPQIGPPTQEEVATGKLMEWAPAALSAQEAIQVAGGCPLLGVWVLQGPQDYVLDVTLSSPDYSFALPGVESLLKAL